ncbi:MAG: hypothetical protein ABSG69_15115 [Candidatus Acidiferrum sp.]|jgi:type VI protein secretion system component VasF
MSPDEEKQLRELQQLLKSAIPRFEGTTPHRDLWPAVQNRVAAPLLHVPWWDWALLAAAALMFFLFPGMIPTLLYHL